MRTFKCRGGLANDEPLQPELVHPLQVGIVDRRLKKSSHCCSPVLAPVMSAMFVGRATFSLTHRCLGFSRVTSCTDYGSPADSCSPISRHLPSF